MLRSNMRTLSSGLTLALQDLLGDLRAARTEEDLGRLALLAYCDVRRWARQADQPKLAELSLALVTSCPFADRESFLSQVDRLMAEATMIVGEIEDEVPLSANGVTAPRRVALRP
jgi:hypothetical protein